MLFRDPSGFEFAVAISYAAKSEFMPVMEAAAEKVRAELVSQGIPKDSSVFLHKWYPATPATQLDPIFCQESVVVVIVDCPIYFTREGCVSEMVSVRRHLLRLKERILLIQFRSSTDAVEVDRIDWLRALEFDSGGLATLRGFKEDGICIEPTSDRGRAATIADRIADEILARYWRVVEDHLAAKAKPRRRVIICGDVDESEIKTLRRKLTGKVLSEEDCSHGPYKTLEQFDEQTDDMEPEVAVVTDQRLIDVGIIPRIGNLCSSGSRAGLAPWPVQVLSKLNGAWSIQTVLDSDISPRHELANGDVGCAGTPEQSTLRAEGMLRHDSWPRIALVAVSNNEKFSTSVQGFYRLFRAELIKCKSSRAAYGFVVLRQLGFPADRLREAHVAAELTRLRKCDLVILCLDDHFAREFGNSENGAQLAEYLHVLQLADRADSPRRAKFKWIWFHSDDRAGYRATDMTCFSEVIRMFSNPRLRESVALPLGMPSSEDQMREVVEKLLADDLNLNPS